MTDTIDWNKVREKVFRLRVKYQELIEDVMTASEVKPNGGHDFGHDLTVAHFAVAITPDDQPELEAPAFLAGILHSLDRYGVADIEHWIRERLHGCVPKKTISMIVSAVTRHDQGNKRKNPLLRVLQDADRLANLLLTVAFRAGAFHHTIPPVAIGTYINWQADPRGNYHNPPTVLRDVANCLNWDPDSGDPKFWITSPKAIPVARILTRMLRTFLENAEEQYRMFGLIL
jgi:hypothetical protein